MTWNTCHRCASKMWIDDALNEAALKARGKINFYCSYGHPQVYCEGESEETKLRRERDRLKQDAARLEDEKRQWQATANAQRERATKLEAEAKRAKKRSAAGTCPCCQRTFSNMSTHMKRQHPEYIKETGANVVPLKISQK